VGAGSSGIGLLSTNTNNTSYKILTTNNENVVCSKLFIKLVPLYTDVKQQPNFSLLLPGMYNALIYSNAELDFWNEVYKQSKIYKKTNENLEPICPPLVYSECLDNNKSIMLFEKLFNRVDKSYDYDKEDDPLYELSYKYKHYNTLKLGIIGMGFTEGYTSLYSMFRNNYPNITHYFEDHLLDNRDDQPKIILAFCSFKKLTTFDKLGNEPVITSLAPCFKAICNNLVPLVVVITRVLFSIKDLGYSEGELP
jgi:hypothetical protein